MLLRIIRPEQLLRVESLPDVTDFFATLQSPITPLLPSFWAGETLFAEPAGRLRSAARRRAVDDGARAVVVRRARPYERWHFAGFSKAQEARKARFTQLRGCSIALARRAAAVDRCGGIC